MLTREAEAIHAQTRHFRFVLKLLAARVVEATRGVMRQHETAPSPLGYFGASTGGAAALIVAAELGTTIRAVVSRGGRPDMASVECRT